MTYDDDWYAVHGDEAMDREDEEIGSEEFWEDEPPAYLEREAEVEAAYAEEYPDREPDDGWDELEYGAAYDMEDFGYYDPE